VISFEELEARCLLQRDTALSSSAAATAQVWVKIEFFFFSQLEVAQLFFGLTWRI